MKITMKATATWDGAWWSVELHGLPGGMTGVTQGKTRTEAQNMAEDAVAILLGVDRESVHVDMHYVGPSEG